MLNRLLALVSVFFTASTAGLSQNSPSVTLNRPSVDILWTVMSNRLCSDNFGRRVADSLYCVEVKLGNNSGYGLAISGIGFQRTILDGTPYKTVINNANLSYASTRAVLLRDQILDRRNIAYRTLEGMGITMSAFTPFFLNITHRSRFAEGAAILSGPLLQGLDLIMPDRTLPQLNNLDDQAFRDTKVIPNNSQTRFVVFVDKRELSEAIAAVIEATGDYFNQMKKKPKGALAKVNGKGAWNAFSPAAVRLALGEPVIVGDFIEYVERIQLNTYSPVSDTVPVNSGK